MGMFIFGAIIGFLIIFSLEFIIKLFDKIIGRHNTNFLVGLLSLAGGILTAFVLVDFINHSLYLYNSMSTFEIIFYGIFCLVILASLYSSYFHIILDERLDSPFLLMVSIFGLYVSIIISQNMDSEIKPDEYKEMNTIYEKVSSNPETKKLYEKIFPEITKDNIVSRKEYKNIIKIKQYFHYLNQQVINKETEINDNNQKKNYLQEAKEKYLIEKSSNN